MDYQAAVAELKTGKLYPVYLLWGEERSLRDDVLAKIKKQVMGGNGGEYGLIVLNGKNLSVERIVETADTAPFFSEKQLILIENWDRWRAGKQTDGDKQKPDEQKFIDYLTKIPPYSCLVFTSDEKIDRRKKLYQSLEKIGAVVEFAPLKGQVLERWIMQIVKDMGKKLGPGVLAFIIGEVGTSETVNLAMLRQELTKIALYTGARSEITKADAQAVLTRTPESSVFTLVDAVSQQQRDKALQLWEDLKVTGQEPLKLLNLLARQIRLTWQAKQLQAAGCAVDQLAGKIGVHPYVAQRVAAQGKKFSTHQLRHSLECLQEADWSVKSGRRDPETMMQLLIVSLCKKA